MNKKIKRILSAAIACAVMTGSAAGAQITASAESAGTAVSASTSAKKPVLMSKTLPMYFFLDTPETKAKVKLYYFDGVDIPYFELDDWIDVQNAIPMFMGDADSYQLTAEKNGDAVTVRRESGYTLDIDFAKNTMKFMDYNAFVSTRKTYYLGLAVLGDEDPDGKYPYLKVLPTTNERYGKEVLIDFSDYNIDLVRRGDKYFIPVQTVSDLFITGFQSNLLYNGKSLILFNSSVDTLVADNKLTPLGEIYYKEKSKKKISKEMAEFSYNEFCLAFDHLYGLKEIHNITSADELLFNSSFKEIMLETDPKKTDELLYRFISQNLDDGHSNYMLSSYASGYKYKKKLSDTLSIGHSEKAYWTDYNEFAKARKDARPDGVPAYEEIGDTAFITFDSFEMNTDDYYEKAPTAEAKDTIGIIAYSVQQILREGSPVKNVVLDLSCNIGGAVDSAIYTIAAFLGTACISTSDPITGALSTSDYKADTNFDYKYDENDTLAGKGLNLYCLESGASFSCGNLVPCVFKDDSRVMLLGQTSGGGSCAIMTLSTSLGTVMRLSSTKRLSFLRNGSFYDVDQGAEPDYVISKKANYYNREALAEYINGLF